MENTLSEKAKALHAYIIWDHITHPDYLENKDFKRLWVLLRWKYKKLWKVICKEANIKHITQGMCSQNDAIMRLFNELPYRFLRSHLGWGGYSVFKNNHYFCYRVINDYTDREILAFGNNLLVNN